MWGERSRPRNLISSILLVAVAGCGEPTELDWVERARELEWLADVPVRTITAGEYRAEVALEVDEVEAAEWRDYADTYGRLGYFPRGLDLPAVVATTSSDWVGAYYSSFDKRVTVIGEPRFETLLHEYVHALQDQHFDLGGFWTDRTTDGLLTRGAIVEGDAVLASARAFMLSNERELEDVLLATSVVWNLKQAEAMLSDPSTPPFFRARPAFHYARGLAFAIANLFSLPLDPQEPIEVPGSPPRDPVRDEPFDPATSPYPGAPFDPELARQRTADPWTQQDAHFLGGGPRSTASVLRLDQDRTPPLAVGLHSVPPGEALDGLEAIGWDTMGAWMVRVLLNPLGWRVTEPLVRRWAGDRVLFVRDPTLASSPTGPVGCVWTLAFTDAEAAQDVRDALELVYRLQRRDDRADPWTQAADGDEVKLTLRGATLVVLKNVAPARAAALVEAAFAPPVAPSQSTGMGRPSLLEWLDRRHPPRAGHSLR